jgi:hypothetical protein
MREPDQPQPEAMVEQLDQSHLPSSLVDIFDRQRPCLSVVHVAIMLRSAAGTL